MNPWVLVSLFVAGSAASLSLYTYFLNERINMSTQAQLDALVSQLNKAHKEICDRLTAAQEDLQAQLTAAGVPAETVDLSALAAIAQQLDDIVPDSPASVEELTESVTESVDQLEAEVDEVAVDEAVEVEDEAVEVVDEVVVDEVVEDEAVDEVDEVK